MNTREKLLSLAIVLLIGMNMYDAHQIEQLQQDKAEMQHEMNRLSLMSYALCVKLADGFCTYTIN